MKTEIMILNCMAFNKANKDTGEVTPLTRLEFVITDFKDSKKYIGTAPITQFYQGHEVFKKVGRSSLLKPLPAEFDIKEDLYNPMSMRKILKKINGIELY